MVIVERQIDGKTIKFHMDGYQYELLMGFKEAVLNHNTSAVMITEGRSGYGKTTLTHQNGITVDPTFNLSKVHFTPESFLDGLANARKGDFISFDEAMLLSNRNAISSVNKMIVVAMSMIRSKNIFVSFCINSIFDLDRNLAISRADALFHVFGQHLYDRGSYGAYFRAKDGNDRLKALYLTGRKYYDYSKVHPNFTARFPSEFVVDEKAYETEKQKGVNAFLLGAEAPTSKAQIVRDKLITLLHDKHDYSVESLMELTGLSRATVFNAMANAKKRSKSGV